jgi:hypothetical protein
MSGYSSEIMRFPEERVTTVVVRDYAIRKYERFGIGMAKLIVGES